MARGYYHVMIAPNRFRQGVVSGATLPSACLSPKRTFGREAPLVSVANALLPVFINTHSLLTKTVTQGFVCRKACLHKLDRS